MPWFEGTHSETRDLDVPPDAARARFADPAAIVAATKNVESSELDGRTIHFVLAEEDYGVLKFKPDYRCTYELDGDTLRWSTSEGNVDQSGEARFEARGAGTRLHYTERIKMNLDVPAMMAPMVQPVIGAVVASEIKGYLDRMLAPRDR